MVEEKILKKLETLIDKLKGLSDKFPAAQNQPKGKGNSVVNSSESKMTAQEISKEKVRATEAAKIYKEILGLGFDEKKISKSAKLYAKEFNIKSLIGDQLLLLNSAINSFLQSVSSNENLDVEFEDESKIQQGSPLDIVNAITDLKNSNEALFYSNIDAINLLRTEILDGIESFNKETPEGSPLDIVNAITDLRDWTHSLLTDNIEAINLLRTEILTAISNKPDSSEGSPLDIVNAITDLRDWTNSLLKENIDAINLLKVDLLKPLSSNKNLVKDLRRELDVLEQTRALGKIFTRSLVQIDLLKDLKSISRDIIITLKNDIGKPIQKLYDKFVDSGKAQKASLNSLNSSINSQKEINVSKKSFEKLLSLLQWNDLLKFNVLQYKVSSFQNAAIITRLEELIALQNQYASERNKKTGISTLFDKLGGSGNLLAFGLGMFFVIKSIVETKSIDAGAILKAVVAVGAFVYLFNKLASNKGNLTEATKTFGIFGFLILMVVIPTLQSIARINFFDFVYSLVGLYFIVESMSHLIRKMEDVSKNKNLMKTMAWFGAFTAIILLGIIPAIQALARIKFTEFALALSYLTITMVSIGGLIKAANKFLDNKELKKTMTWFGAFTAIILLGIIPAIQALAKINFLDFLFALGYLAIIMASIGGLIKVANKFLDDKDLMKLMKSFGLFSLIISFLIIPTLLFLSELSFGTILNGLIKFLIIGTTVGLIVSLISKSVKQGDLIKMVASFGLFSLVIAFIIIPLMEKISAMPIATYLSGLLKLSVLMITFSFVLKLVSKQMPSPIDLLKIFVSLAVAGLLVKFILIPMFDSLNELNKTPYLKSTLMFMLVIGILIGALILVAKAPLMEILKGMLVLIALSFTIGYLADNLMKLAKLEWGAIMNGLAVASVAILAFGLFVAGVGFLVTFAAPFLAIGLVTILALSLVVGVLADSFMKFTKVNWKKAENNMQAAASAVTALVGLVLVLGVMFTLFLPFMLVGILAINSIGYIIEVLSLQLVKFNKIDGKKLREVGIGLKELGVGLISFTVGMVAALAGAAIATLGEFFGLDVVSHIRKFEDLDSSAIESVGNSLEILGSGLLAFVKAINVGPNVFEAFFKADVTKSIKKLLDLDVAKLTEVSFLLDILGEGLTKFVTAYKDMQEVGADGVKTFISAILSLEQMKDLNLDPIKQAFSDVSEIFSVFDPLVEYALSLESFNNELYELFDIFNVVDFETFLLNFSLVSESLDNVKLSYDNLDVYSVIFGITSLLDSVDSTLFNENMYGIQWSFDKIKESYDLLDVYGIITGFNDMTYMIESELFVEKFSQMILKLDEFKKSYDLIDVYNIIVGLNDIGYMTNIEPFVDKFETMIWYIDAFRNAYHEMDIYSIITGFNEAIEMLNTDIFNTKFFDMKNSVDSLAESLNKLTDSYKNFQDVAGESSLNSITNVNYENAELAKMISKAHDAEMSVLQSQLDQLRINGDVLQQIRDGVYQIPSAGSNAPTVVPSSLPTPPQNSKTSFRTKETYLNNLKLMNMSIT